MFLVIPECPAPLLGRDLLTKVNAQNHFDPGGMTVTDGLGQPIHVLSPALRDEYRLFAPKPSETIAPDVQPWVHKYPLAWAETAGMGLAKQRHPVVIELKAGATPVRVRQYPMSQQARWGITPHIQRLMICLPQGFKNSSTLLNEALSEDLYEYQTCHPEVILLQYVDDLMLAGTTEEACSHATGDLLQTLGTLGYRTTRIPPSRRMTKMDGTEIKTTT